MNLSRAVAVSLLSSALVACGPSPAPRPAGAASASTPPRAGLASAPAPTAAAAPAPTAAPTSAANAPPTIIIHEAELFGELHFRAGKTVTMSSRLITSRTEPQIGNIGVLFQRTDAASGDPWVPIADVEIKSKLDKNSRITLTITQEKRDLPADRKTVPFAPKSRLRLQWQWQ